METYYFKCDICGDTFEEQSKFISARYHDEQGRIIKSCKKHGLIEIRRHWLMKYEGYTKAEAEKIIKEEIKNLEIKNGMD